MPEENPNPPPSTSADGGQNQPDPRVPPPPTPPEPGAPPENDPPLGEGGQRALESERTLRRDAERRARETEAELTRLREAQLPEQERIVEQARREATEAALKTANERLVRASVIGAAAGKLANPQIAARLVDMSSIDVDADGNVDDRAVASAIEQLLKDEPYLAVGGRQPPPTGSGDGGPRGNTPPATSFSDQLRHQAKRH